MYPTPDVPPAPASQYSAIPQAPATNKRGRLFYIGLAGLALGGLCCILGVVALIISFSMNRKAAPAVSTQPINNPTTTNLPAATAFPTETSLPTATRLSAATTFPTATNTSLPEKTPLATTQTPGGNATTFADDFSNSNSGWTVVSTDGGDESYNPLGFYEMGVKHADYYLISISPDNLPRPLKNILLNVRAQPAVGDTGEYGVVCRFQDIDNFYLAAISGNRFYIGKLVNGEWTYLTDPGWQALPDSTPDAEGYQVISMSCIDSFIVLEVNGIGAAHVTDDELSDGQAGLCVWAGDTAGKGGYYARAAFDDFSASLP